jgi:hypothetical protein
MTNTPGPGDYVGGPPHDHGYVCPACGHDAAALLREIERLRLRLRTLERYGVDPWPATGTNVSVIEIRP